MLRITRRELGLVALLVWTVLHQQVRAAHNYFVAPDGSASNRGTVLSPWDLRTALSGAKGAIQPGDTVYVFSGTYRGHFLADVSGTPSAPVTFKAFGQGESVLDGNSTTTTASVTKAGRPDDEVSVSLASVTDIRSGSQIVVGGGSGHDELLFVGSVRGRTVSGNRRCVLDASCAELPSGSTVWVLQSVLHIPPTVHDVWFHGFEITDSGTDHRIWSTASDDDFVNNFQRRQSGIFNYGARTKIIDCVVHDVVNGIGAWTPAVDSEYSGVIAFNNGVLAPDRGHGHGFYIQNELTGTKTFRHIVSLQNFGFGAQMYVSRDDLPQGNAVFDETVWVAADPGSSPPVNQHLLLGGSAPLRNVTVRGSHFYGRPPHVGYSNPNNDGISFTNNIFRTALEFSLSKHVTVTGNIFAAPPGNDSTLVHLRFDGDGNVPADYTFSNNVYYGSNRNFPYHQFFVAPTSGNNCGYFWWNSTAEAYGYCPTPQSWQETLGYDKAGSTFNTSPPTGATVVALVDRYDSHRRLVVVHNWDGAPTVSLDASTFGWRHGLQYTLRNVADYYGDVVHRTYDGSATIVIPMTGHTIAKPYGYPDALAVSTFPDFGVFVLTLDDPS